MKGLYTFILVSALTLVQAQNTTISNLEFEKALHAFREESYETAIKHLDNAEKHSTKWSAQISCLKIESLYALADMNVLFNPDLIQPLYEEVLQYRTNEKKITNNDIPLENCIKLATIEDQLESLKLAECQSQEFLKAKKQYDDGHHDTSLPLWKSLANQGNSWAMVYLSLLYHEKNQQETAIEWANKSMSKQNALGMLLLAQLDGANEGKWFEKMVQLRHPYGYFYLGWRAENVDGDKGKAMEYYLKSADMGCADALYKVGEEYRISGDFTKSLPYLKKAANKGNTKSMYLIGWAYEKGVSGYIQDYLQAEKWYQKAAEKGSKDMYLNIANMYCLADNNIPQKALANFEKAAEAGYAQGMLQSANLYFSGKGGIPNNYVKATKYYEEYYNKSKKGGAYLENLIKIYNQGGYGMKMDKAKAEYWRSIRNWE